MQFKNRTAIVTGASVGIGRACALKLAEGGADLALVDLDYEKLEKVKAEVEAAGACAIIFKCDVSDEEAVNKVVEKTIQRFEKIDVLINNASIWRMFKSFTEMTSEDWSRLLSVNVMGTVNFSRAVLPGMISRNYGRIVNVSSVAGIYGNRNMTAYSATKGAVNSLTKALAKEVADKGILVNSVCPGSVSSSENPDIDSYEESQLSFMGRTGTDRENANLICFLAGDDASYISGQTIQIDGCRKTL